MRKSRGKSSQQDVAGQRSSPPKPIPQNQRNIRTYPQIRRRISRREKCWLASPVDSVGFMRGLKPPPRSESDLPEPVNPEPFTKGRIFNEYLDWIEGRIARDPPAS